MKCPEPSQMSPEKIQRELAQILATGYLRLCAEAAQASESAASQQRSGASEGQDASAGAGEGP